MKLVDVLQLLKLEDKHYEWVEQRVPSIEPSLYNTLGRRLYEIYQKYSVEASDQRELEALHYLLVSFLLRQDPQSRPAKKSWWRKQA